jgi:hypothetical protein
MWPKIKQITKCYVKKNYCGPSTCLPSLARLLAFFATNYNATQHHNEKHKCNTKAHKQQHCNAKINANINKVTPTTMFMVISTKDNHQGNYKDQNIKRG